MEAVMPDVEKLVKAFGKWPSYLLLVLYFLSPLLVAVLMR
jgi:hypothetical protein